MLYRRRRSPAGASRRISFRLRLQMPGSRLIIVLLADPTGFRSRGMGQESRGV